MSSTKQILDSDILDLEDIIRILADPVEDKKFSAIDQGLKISAKYIWIMRSIPVLGVTDYIGDNAGTVRRFFNETVQFIEGKRRPIRIESWHGIITDIIRQYDENQQLFGNIGSQFVTKSVERRGLVSTSVGHSAVDRSLLSYAHYEIMLKWMVRDDGVYDMLKSILLLTSIYKRYYPNGDGSAATAAHSENSPSS